MLTRTRCRTSAWASAPTSCSSSSSPSTSTACPASPQRPSTRPTSPPISCATRAYSPAAWALQSTSPPPPPSVASTRKASPWPASTTTPRGINPPHVHPRANEVFFLAQGKLLVGFVTTAPDNKLFYQTIYAGDLFVFPRGLVHFQLNPDKNKPARAIAALNNQNPGASQLAVALFNSDPPLPEEVLETTLGIGDDELRRVIASVKKTLA
ncbi:hypothetical protein L7F22_022502 [Adiantum nelumboides]|nr:hypothetical protein [Adiantum nelumboides]